MKRQRSVTLDDFDLKILRLVQVDNQMPQRSIGDKVGLSPLRSRGGFSTFARTRSSGRHAVVDESLVERPLTIVVHITTENERLDLLDGMKDRFQRCPQVRQCYYVTGEMDFVLIMNVKDMAE